MSFFGVQFSFGNFCKSNKSKELSANIDVSNYNNLCDRQKNSIIHDFILKCFVIKIGLINKIKRIKILLKKK